jgi:hypothetical protein
MPYLFVLCFYSILNLDNLNLRESWLTVAVAGDISVQRWRFKAKARASYEK